MRSPSQLDVSHGCGSAVGVRHEMVKLGIRSRYSALAHLDRKGSRLGLKFARELLCSIQQGGREIEADDISPTTGKGERVSSVTTADIGDGRCRAKLQQVPQAAHLQPHIV